MTSKEPTTENRSHLTAIARTATSKPMRYLSATNRLVGRVLDFGCGRGYDADVIGCERFDPHWFPIMPVGTFDVVVVNYVFNVIPSLTERCELLRSIQGLIKAPSGIAFISVRNDRRNLNGYTSRGTWQGLIELDLPIVTKNSNFIMYQLEGLQQ
jgi:ATP adenylyltransferase